MVSPLLGTTPFERYATQDVLVQHGARVQLLASARANALHGQSDHRHSRSQFASHAQKRTMPTANNLCCARYERQRGRQITAYIGACTLSCALTQHESTPMFGAGKPHVESTHSVSSLAFALCFSAFEQRHGRGMIVNQGLPGRECIAGLERTNGQVCA